MTLEGAQRKLGLPVVDGADEESCRPGFAVALYPGHLWVNEDRKPSTPGTTSRLPTHHTTAEESLSARLAVNRDFGCLSNLGADVELPSFEC
jgi:hypothetical protein